MSQENWATLRAWMRRVFGPVEGAELFHAQVEEARELGVECPRELAPGF